MLITPTNKIRSARLSRRWTFFRPRNRHARGGRGDCQKYLAEKFGIEIRGCLTQMGDIPLEIKDWSQVEQNPFFCPDPDKIDALDELMRALKKRATPSARKSPL